MAGIVAGRCFGETHDESFLITNVDHQCRNSLFAQGFECLETTFATHQQIMLLSPSGLFRWRNGYRFLETDGLNVADDLLENTAVALAWIEDLNLSTGII